MKTAKTAFCVTFLAAALAGCEGAKPVYLEADKGQVGAGAILFLVDTTGTGTLMMKATADHPEGVLEDVKLTDKVDAMTAPVWTLTTQDMKRTLIFAPSPSGLICQSCDDYKLPIKWHAKERSA